MSRVFQTKDKSIVIFHNKANGLFFHFGYECGNSCNCKFRKQCKYACRVKKNLYFQFRDWVKDKFHIKLPWPRVHFGKTWVELSGTHRCPFGTTRKTGCHQCKHCAGTDENCHLLCGLLKDDGHGYTTYDDEYWHH